MFNCWSSVKVAKDLLSNQSGFTSVFSPALASLIANTISYSAWVADFTPIRPFLSAVLSALWLMDVTKALPSLISLCASTCFSINRDARMLYNCAR